MTTDIKTSKELRDVIATSALAQLMPIADVLTAAGIDIKILARAIGGSAATVAGPRLGFE